MLIFLVGYMGAGKSNVAVLLAKKMNFRFIDTDSWIENRCCKTVSDIFNDSGEEYFRSKEKECLEFLIDKDDIVVATGGGLPCSNDLIDFMNELGEVVYLQASITTLKNRLFSGFHLRPLIDGFKDEEELESFIQFQLAVREPVYKLSKHVIEVDNLKKIEIVSTIHSMLS